MSAVKLARQQVVLPLYGMDPFSPHPPFPQWARWDIYPHPVYGSVTKRLTHKSYVMLTMENEFLRVTIAPDIGGRVWDLYDKIGRRHVVNFTNSVHTYNAGFGLNYTTGGIEVNYPVAHSPTTNRPREVSSARHEDGSVSITCGEYDRIWRTRWSVTYTLRPDGAFLEMRVRVYNRSPHYSRYMYWNNCGFYVTPSTEYVFPEREASMHGTELRTFSWPMWRHRDLSKWNQVPPEMLGLYMLHAEEPFFGYYDHAEQYGLVHYGDLADLPGKKSWTWGTDPDYCATLSRTHHGLGKVFGEMQAGRIVIQEHLDRVPPETEFTWHERWYPVRDLGGFNGAGPGAAIHMESVASDAGRTVVRVRVMGNTARSAARLCVSAQGTIPVVRDLSLSARSVCEEVVALKVAPGNEPGICAVVQGLDGEVLASARLRKPNTRDCWREAHRVEPEVKPVGVEEMFLHAERKARDWGNHDEKPLYESVLAVDPGFSPAHRELGKILLARGLNEPALSHFDAALRRDDNSLETRYFRGLALLALGRPEDAQRSFELANRYHWEAASTARLSEIAMRAGDWCRALRHLERLAEAQPRLTRPRILRAACWRRMGRWAYAQKEIDSTRAIDPHDPLLQIEAAFVRAGNPDADALPRAQMRALLAEVREEEPPLLQAAHDYLAAGLLQETLRVIELIPQPGPLALLTQAWTLRQLGRNSQAMRSLRRALAADPVYHHPWQEEFFRILMWACEAMPRSGRPHYLLGNLLMARRRAEEGLAQWKKASETGEKHWLLPANLGFYHARVALNRAQALRCFQSAHRRNPQDLYVLSEIAALLGATKGPHAVVRYLNAHKKELCASPRLAHTYLNACLDLKQYRAFDALCRKVDFTHHWQVPGPVHLWHSRHFREALDLLSRGKAAKALEILETLSMPPANLGMTSAKAGEADRRWYHIGCCYERLGDTEKARQAWERCLAVPHYTGYEHSYRYREWSWRYFQALALQKLGRDSEANALLDAMELLAESQDLPAAARNRLLETVERGRFAPDDQKDPQTALAKVDTSAEE